MKEFTIKILKKILVALHEMRFSDVIGLVDESYPNEEKLVEFIRETVGFDGFKLIDEFSEENIAYISSEDRKPFDVVYYLRADGGKQLNMVLRLGVVTDRNGSRKIMLNFERIKTETVILLDDTDEYDAVWNRVRTEFGFRPGMRESVPFRIDKPYAVYGIENMTERQIDMLEAAGADIFARISAGRVYALDWQHSALLYDPRDSDEQKDFWFCNSRYAGGGYNVCFPSFYPDGDYHFFIDESFEFGLLGHPWRQEIRIFGEPLLTEFGKIYSELGLTLKGIL